MPRGGPRPNSGGARPGAGRKPRQTAVAESDDPLKFLLAVMNDSSAAAELRVKAAASAMPYVHAKKEIGKKKEQAERAGKAAGGRFQAAPPPLKLVGSR